MWSRTLVALVAVAAFVAWFAYPGESGPREGRELCGFQIRDMGPGENRTLAFPVREAYDELTFNYNLTNASKLRAALTGPDAERHDAIPNVQANTLDLRVQDPAVGTWRLNLWTLTDPPGHIESGHIFILGHGGTIEPGSRVPATSQGCYLV